MTSALRFAAINATLGGLVERLKSRLLERRVAGRHELPNEEIDTFARTARVCSYNAVSEAYALGRADGHRGALEQYGLPAEGEPDAADVAGTPTKPLHTCPTCGFPHRKWSP